MTVLVGGVVSKILFSLFGYISKKRLSGKNNVDILHVHFGQDAYYGMRLAEKLNIPFVVTFHGQDCCVSDRSKLSSGQISNYIYLLNRRKIFYKAAKIIAVSKFIKDVLVAQGCPEEKIVVHYIGVDASKFKLNRRRAEDSLVDEQLNILSVGRHVEKKGLPDLLEAVRLCGSAVKLRQVGDGEEREKNIKLVRKLGIEKKVEFLGVRSPQEISDLLNQSDIFCLPSVRARNGDSEAFGIVFLEAASAGVPVVSTFHGGIPEAVVDGVTGYLAPEKNPMILAKLIDKLASDKELRLKMGMSGRARVEREFNVKDQSALLMNIYEEVCSRGVV